MKTLKPAIIVSQGLLALALFVGIGWHTVATHAASNTGTLVVKNSDNAIHSYALLYSTQTVPIPCYSTPATGSPGDTQSIPSDTSVQVQGFHGSHCEGDAITVTNVTVPAGQTTTVVLSIDNPPGLEG